MTVYLHIGLHKTGTSSIQASINRNKAAIEAKGYLVSDKGVSVGAHHNAPYDVLKRSRFDPKLGSAGELAAQTAKAENAIVTSEEFEFLDLDGVRRTRDVFGEQDVKVICYLRRQDSLITSTFAQQIKMGARMGRLGEYVSASLYHPRFAFTLLLSKWVSVFGAEAMSVGVICEETYGDKLHKDFQRRIGLDGVELAPPRRLMNESPSYAEVELIRRIVATGRPKGGKLDEADMRRVREWSANCATERGLAQLGRVSLSPADLERTARRFDAGNAVIGRYLETEGQRDALRFGTGEGDDEILIDEGDLDELARIGSKKLGISAGAAGVDKPRSAA